MQCIRWVSLLQMESPTGWRASFSYVRHWYSLRVACFNSVYRSVCGHCGHILVLSRYVFPLFCYVCTHLTELTIFNARLELFEQPRGLQHDHNLVATPRHVTSNHTILYSTLINEYAYAHYGHWAHQIYPSILCRMNTGHPVRVTALWSTSLYSHADTQWTFDLYIVALAFR